MADSGCVSAANDGVPIVDKEPQRLRRRSVGTGAALDAARKTEGGTRLEVAFADLRQLKYIASFDTEHEAYEHIASMLDDPKEIAEMTVLKVYRWAYE